MAMSFGEEFARIVDEYARQEVERTYIWMRTEPFAAVTDETKTRAKEFAQRLEDEGKTMAFLEATEAKPCPECGV